MIDILNRYLIQHKSINIPGLGTIFIEHLPATLDVVNKRILPPHYEFRFNKYFDTPDKEFFTYLSAEKGIQDYEAIQLYNQFAQDLRTSIKLDDKAIWEDVGVFTKNSAGDMVFEQLNKPRALYAPVSAVRVVRNMAAHAVLVGDQEKTTIEMSGLLNPEKTEEPATAKRTWWMYALIVFIAALIFLFFYFYQHGFTLASVSNQRPLHLQTSEPRRQ